LFLPISVTAAGLFYACAVGPVERSRAWIAAWNERGLEALHDVCTDDVVLVEREDVLEASEIHGLAVVKDRYAERMALVGPSQAAVRSIEAVDATRALADMNLHVHGQASGVEGEFRMVHLYTFRGERIARIDEYPDRETALAASGSVVGSWRLVEWTFGDEHPLGPDAVGRLIYSGDGYMSALLARADGFSDALSYSGTWELRGREEVVHRVSVSTRGSFVGRELVREISWVGDDLVLTTPPPVNVLRWRREAG